MLSCLELPFDNVTSDKYLKSFMCRPMPKGEEKVSAKRV